MDPLSLRNSTMKTPPSIPLGGSSPVGLRRLSTLADALVWQCTTLQIHSAAIAQGMESLSYRLAVVLGLHDGWSEIYQESNIEEDEK